MWEAACLIAFGVVTVATVALVFGWLARRLLDWEQPADDEDAEDE